MVQGRETLHVGLDNLHCEGCAETLRAVLREHAGIEVPQIDVDRRALRVSLNRQTTSREELRDLLHDAGFIVTSIEHIDGRGEAEQPPAGRVTPYALLALALLLLGSAGYVGYQVYPRFDLPSVDGAALLLLAAGAGIASFFSPCAFGLLATLLAREGGGNDTRPNLARPWRFATGMSVGASIFVLTLGAVIALGGSALVAGVTFTSPAGRLLRLVVGVFLVLMGLIQLELLPSPLHRVEQWALPLQRLSARQRRQRPFWGNILFGFGYLLAGFG